MGTGATRRFNLGWARTQLAVGVFVALVQVLAGANAWRDAAGPDAWTLLWLAFAVLSVLGGVINQAAVVSVGDGRIAWGLGRWRHDLSFDEVADIRKHPRWDRSELVTTDGRVLRVPLPPHHGPEAWHLVLGDRAPSPP